jgi:hypothetical protein
MGGVGSTRWGSTVTRLTTEGLPRLDVRELAAQGALRDGTSTVVAWSDRASIAIEVIGTDKVTLRYGVDTADGARWLVCDDIPLQRTRCRFGGERVWFACSGCAKRRAVLFAVRGIFRCRECHRLAYGSTRSNTCRSVR